MQKIVSFSVKSAARAQNSISSMFAGFVCEEMPSICYQNCLDFDSSGMAPLERGGFSRDIFQVISSLFYFIVDFPGFVP